MAILEVVQGVALSRFCAVLWKAGLLRRETVVARVKRWLAELD